MMSVPLVVNLPSEKYNGHDFVHIFIYIGPTYELIAFEEFDAVF